MQAYQDITLLPGDDIGHHFLWEKVYQQVHLALVDNKNNHGNPVGITFPEFNTDKHRLGRKLRLFAPDIAALEKVAINRWLERLTDYVHITGIRPVPDKLTGYVRFDRLRPKSNKERLARRSAKRQGIGYEEALAQYKDFQPEYTQAPFIWAKSTSRNQRFRLFISQKSTTEVGTTNFNAYGLTKTGALPHF
ncbi:type I-F CRISPR-associated endoribonuclease Cas6/Csy4 [Endozoicomonas sp. (ex Bugula neritina AB1)]|nr:type I-F CRISPR-associated endoribonuclease Cas6/Csy4 [Endozoicomonas sp. (ex Bugula neritina AB1)]